MGNSESARFREACRFVPVSANDRNGLDLALHGQRRELLPAENVAGGAAHPLGDIDLSRAARST
jgi:hypothetical protein